MYNVTIEKQCGCFRRSGMPAIKTFESKDDALVEAKDWADDMNSTFCKKHAFDVVQDGENFVIRMASNG